jgi:hypothetical protein
MRRALGVLLAVAGVGLMLYSQLIRAGHASVPPSKEEIEAQSKRRRIFGAGAALSLFGLLLLLMP